MKMIIKSIITIALIIFPIWGIIKVWTVPPQEVKYNIKEHKEKYYIERSRGVYGIDFYQMTVSTEIYFTNDVREAKVLLQELLSLFSIN